jgi:sialate O-acetylesterase
LAANPYFKFEAENLKKAIATNSYDVNVASACFNNMCAPIIPFAVKGAIWYQGEGNAGAAGQYCNLLNTMVKDWRTRWENKDMPFLVVQLANFLAPPVEPGPSSWGELREAQVQMLKTKNTGLALAIDIGDAADIHPKNKQDVGYRLYLAARKVAYGEDLVYSGPMYRSMSRHGNKIVIKFNHVASGLVAKGGELKQFAIAGADQKFYWAKAVIDGKNVVVTSDKVEKPVAVRYAWAENPEGCNLYNSENLPASPFRTDKWPGITAGLPKK